MGKRKRKTALIAQILKQAEKTQKTVRLPKKQNQASQAVNQANVQRTANSEKRVFKRTSFFLRHRARKQKI